MYVWGLLRGGQECEICLCTLGGAQNQGCEICLAVRPEVPLSGRPWVVASCPWQAAVMGDNAAMIERDVVQIQR
eukprot:1161790-Lingulodinium_polyedra.AAC.1